MHANKIDGGIIVVNDGSIDSTPEVLQELDCVCLNLPINVGIGGAVQLGMQYARIRGFDAAIQLDGDGQHPAEEIPRLVQPLMENVADVVIGSRFIQREGFQSTVGRRLGIRYLNFLQKVFSGKTITDSTSGFRALNRTALQIAADYYPDQYPEPESIVLFAKHNLRVREIPVSMRDRQAGHSSIRYFASVYYIIKVTLAMISMFYRKLERTE